MPNSDRDCWGSYDGYVAPCETKLVAIETEGTVEVDLAAILQTRNTKNQWLDSWRMIYGWLDIAYAGNAAPRVGSIRWGFGWLRLQITSDLIRPELAAQDEFKV
jgi:hypothetical protein